MNSRKSGKQPARASGRSSGRVPVDTAARTSQRMVPEGSARHSQRTSQRRSSGGKELAICSAVIVILVVVCAVLYSQRKGEKQAVNTQIEKDKRLKETNVDMAYQAMQKAVAAGRLFLMGKDPDIYDEKDKDPDKRKRLDDKLFAPFRSDDRIYNVVYIRDYKDKRNNTKPDQKEMDSSHLKDLGRANTPLDSKDGITFTRGKAEGNSLEIVFAEKDLQGEAGDKINMGGKITVILKAVTK